MAVKIYSLVSCGTVICYLKGYTRTDDIAADIPIRAETLRPALVLVKEGVADLCA